MRYRNRFGSVGKVLLRPIQRNQDQVAIFWGTGNVNFNLRDAVSVPSKTSADNIGRPPISNFFLADKKFWKNAEN